MSDEPRGLWSRLKWIVLIAWIVAAVRLALDFRLNEGETAEFLGLDWQTAIGVYYVMPILLVIGGLVGVFRGLGYGRLVLAMLFLSILCWFLPNAIAYNVGQFQEWTHGRFAPAPVDAEEEGAADDVLISGKKGEPYRSAPIARSTSGKILSALVVAGATAGAGFVWCFIWMNLLIYLPRRLRRNE